MSLAAKHRRELTYVERGVIFGDRLADQRAHVRACSQPIRSTFAPRILPSLSWCNAVFASSKGNS